MRQPFCICTGGHGGLDYLSELALLCKLFAFIIGVWKGFLLNTVHFCVIDSLVNLVCDESVMTALRVSVQYGDINFKVKF